MSEGRDCGLFSPRTLVALLFVLIGTGFISSGKISARQAAGSAPAALKKEIESLAPFIGGWECSNSFAKSGKPISSALNISPALEGAWLIVRHDDHPPNQFHALELWGFDKSAHQVENPIFDNFGGSRKFVSPGWSGPKFIWTRTGVAPEAATERYLFELLSSGELRVT